MWFALFPSHLSKVPRRSKAEDLMLQNATHLRKSMPWPPDMSDEDVSCTVPATQNAFLQILFKLQTSHPYCRFWNCYKTLAFWLTCGEVQNPLRLPRKGTIQRPKVVRTWCVLTFWLRHALCATAAGLFEEVNFQRCSDNEVFLNILAWTCGGKTPCSATFLPVRASWYSFYWLSLLWLFPPLLLHLSICWSLTSKFPSTNSWYTGCKVWGTKRAYVSGAWWHWMAWIQ